MTYSVYQHWDPLKVCIVGRSYPPEFYSWITVPHVRKLFEKIAIETEEDFQSVIKKLEEFDVEVLRPDTPSHKQVNGKFLKPPMNPRDNTVMIGNNFYINDIISIEHFYRTIKKSSWPECRSVEDFDKLPDLIKDECANQNYRQIMMDYRNPSLMDYSVYDSVFEKIKQNSIVKYVATHQISGAMISRIGKDLYFGTQSGLGKHVPHKPDTLSLIDAEFSEYRTHVIDTGGHSDGVYCPVAPGLIISLKDIPTYANTFPGWEVVYLPGQSWAKVRPFLDLKEKNRGKWWIPGFEHDTDVVNVVETWLDHWTGYVEETVFDVNMLIIDPKNVMVFNYNKQVFDALSRYGITPHIVPFRHRYFWDGGIHCITSDVHREGTMQDYFPERGQ